MKIDESVYRGNGKRQMDGDPDSHKQKTGVNSRRKVHIIVRIEIYENQLCTFSLTSGAKAENLMPNEKYIPKKIMSSFTFAYNYVEYWVNSFGTNLFEHIIVSKSEFPLQQPCSS